MGRRAPLRRWWIRHARRSREAVRHRVGALPGSAGARIPIHSEYRPDRGALAHGDEDARRGDPGGHVAARLAGDESARRAAPESQAARSRERDFETQPRGPGGIACHGNHRAGAGVHAVPFRGNKFESGDPERIRPDLARTEFQAVRREGGEKWSGLEENRFLTVAALIESQCAERDRSNPSRDREGAVFDIRSDAKWKISSSSGTGWPESPAWSRSSSTRRNSASPFSVTRPTPTTIAFCSPACWPASAPPT